MRRLKCLLVSFALLVPMCTWAEDYQLWVGQTQVNSENAADVLRNGTVSFSVTTDPATGGAMNVLTLNGATIASGSIECGLDNLTIQLKGSNTVDNSIYYSGQTEGSSLTFTKDETETGVCKLVIGNNSSQSAAIYGFSSLNYGSGMSLAAAYPAAYSSGGLYNTTTITSNVEYIRHATITSATVYPVWYNGEQVTSESAANLSNTDTPEVYFDIQTGTLTFDHSEQEYSKYAVAFDMSRFNVNLVGNNAITLSQGATAFKSYNADAGLKFTTDEDNPGSMFVNFDGPFVDGMDMSFENGLVLEEGTDGYTIAKAYDIWIGGTRVNTINRENVLGESVATVQFDGDHTLTLTGVTIEGGIESGLENLTILLANDVSNPDVRSNNISSIVSTNEEATLTFGKVTTAESADLDLSAKEAVISGFASIDLGDMKWMYEGAPLIYKNKALVSASTGDPATWAALSSQGMEEEPILWIDDSPIVGNDTDGGDQTPATWSFVAETKTLTLSGASLSSPIITNFAGTLNIVLSGTNTIQNTDGPILPAAFVAYKSGVSLAFQEVEVATSAAKLTMTTTSAFDGFAKVSYSGNLALKKSNSGYEISNNSSGYGITIITGTNDGDIQITPSNRESILDGTIKFDGKKTLILDGATFAGISIESTNTLVDGLNVYLKGDNRIENGTNAIINYSSSMPLSIETDDIDPGTLIYINSTCSLKVANQAFSNFEPITYKNGLVATLDYTDDEIFANNSEINYDPDDPSYIGSQTVTIAVTMNPIVDAIENKQVDVVGDLQAQGGSIPTTGVVLDNVLYTLSADGDGITVTDASGNAIPVENQTVGITTTMTEEDVNAIARQVADGTLVPGTLEFAAAFKGMTFLLPAGTGNIIINVRTNESGKLAMKIGNQPAVTFEEAKTAFGELVVPFACSVPTYVLLYNQRAATESREMGSRRAPGRKETATVEIKGLSVSASSVVAVPEPALSPVMLDKSAVAKEAGKHFIKVNNPDVAGVDADAFVAVKEDKELTYVDLTKTGIKGITVDRSTDAFQNVPEKAFIYLPAGNKVKAGTKNVIIGSVCENMEMADDARFFEMAQDFTALQVKQDRDYSDFVGKNCTVYLPFAIDAETAASLGTFYELKGYDGTTVSMESVTETKANTPYMFKPKAADTKVAAKMVTVKAALAEAPVAGNALKIKFVGTYEKKDIVSDDGSSTQYYCFMADGVEAGKFVHVITTPVTMNPYRAYMVVEGGAVTARELDLVIDGVSTGIKNMKVGTDDNVYYDLQGRRVLYPTKGLYIVNGRKVIIK